MPYTVVTAPSRCLFDAQVGAPVARRRWGLGVVFRGNFSNSHDLLPEPRATTRRLLVMQQGRVNCTPSLNQHIPQYCRSC